ncbi:hypothetical protein BC351_35570 [Paenibacillus ferrarius]|uniref:Uncharacterized protein n=1 Tax=Paenibacillus ferrarius TaxID=1469647 RepID=A0A1V4HCR5_9BACL|nr:hypothetical protein BC351_35570 [Paenibacillus ferrarius]
MLLLITHMKLIQTTNVKKLSAIEKVNSQSLWCEEHNILYTVKLENEIRKNQILFENKKLLLPKRCCPDLLA